MLKNFILILSLVLNCGLIYYNPILKKNTESVEVKVDKDSVTVTPPDTSFMGYAVPFDSAYVKCNRKHCKRLKLNLCLKD